MLDDRERKLLDEIEWRLLADPELQRRLASRGPRTRRTLATCVLVACVVFLAVTAIGVLVLGLPGQSLVVVTLAVWPAVVLRRRNGRRRRSLRAVATDGDRLDQEKGPP